MNWKIIHEPYPFDDSLKRAIISSVAFGLFIFMFLFFFQPFGLNNYQGDNKTLQLLGYGLVTTFLLLFNFFVFYTLFPKWYNKKSWTVGKNIAYTTWVFFTIGFGNLLYSVSQHFLAFTLNGFLFYQGMTLLVGIIPVVFSTLMVYHKRMKSMVKQAEGLNDSIKVNAESSAAIIQIPSQNKSENASLNIDQLLYVKSTENYVELFSYNGSEINKEIVRNTLKNLETIFSPYQKIQKCHRSYVVNLEKVKHFSGNAQGLSLHFNDEIKFVVPVSRAYVKEIKMALSE